MRLFALCLAVLTVALGGSIVPELEEILSNARTDERIAVIAHTRTQADLARLPADADYDAKLDHLQSVAETAQRDILAWLETTGAENIKPFWLTSRIALYASPAVIRELAARPDVDYVMDNFITTIDPAITPTSAPDAAGWNITTVKAPDCWAEGYDGSGIVVGNIDTGVYVDHPAFGNRWRSQNGWFDAVNNQPDPYDDSNHGTHCMGTAVGANGIGVAPGASFIAAKAINRAGEAQAIWLSSCLDWMAGTGRPDVLSNSWSGPRTNAAFFTHFNNLRQLGIVTVAAIGNSGSRGSSSNAPGNFPIVIGVGATDNSDAIASFSSRGPAPDSDPWNKPEYWPRPDWNLINPAIAAPGVGINSALRNGGYGSSSGTSMSAPHLAGAAALLLQRNPELTRDEIFNLLTDHADRPAGGGSYPNNDYGWGRLNCKAALDHAVSTTAPHFFLTRTSITDDPNGNRRLDPGETANLITHIRNLSKIAATDLRGTLRTTDSHVSVIDSIAVFGNLAGQDSTNNLSDPFRVSASETCPEGHVARMTLFLACDETTATREFDLMVGLEHIPGEMVMDHDAGYARLTVSAQGAIGYDAVSGTGSGFRYPKTGENSLFYASFAVGNSQSYVADRYFGRPVHGPQNVDLRAVDSLRPVRPPVAGTQHYRAVYDDAGHPLAKGLKITQNSYMTAETGYDHFIVMVFDIENAGQEPVNGLYAGVFADFDVGPNPVANTAASDETRRLVSMRQETTANPTVGLKILQPRSFANLTAIDHIRYIYPDSALTEGMKWRFLNGTTSQRNSDRPYNWSAIVSSGSFNLAVGQQFRFAVAFVGGTSEELALAHADSAQNWYESRVGIIEQPSRQARPAQLCEILPNPFSGRTTVRLQIPRAGPVRVNVLDVTGRQIATLVDAELPAGQRELSWQPGNIANGVYFVRAEIGGNTETRSVLLTR